MLLFEKGDLSIISGGVRNGKTLLMVLLANQAFKSGFDIYYNMESLSLNGLNPNNYIKDLNSFKKKFHEIMNNPDLIKRNKFLLLDELGSLMPTMDYSSLKWLSPYITQLNKIGFTTVGTSQSFDMVYNRYRDNANKRYLVERYPNTDLFRVLVQKQSRIHFGEYKTIFTFTFKGRGFYHLYDTHEVLFIKN